MIRKCLQTQRLRIQLIVAFCALAPIQAFGANPAEWFEQNGPALKGFYEDLHSHPELSLQEKRTAEKLAEKLESTGAKVTRNVGGHGVVAVLENGAGPVVLVRSDLDALPVTEATGAAYASKVRVADSEGRQTGVMHACGHDIHMTCLAGTAKWLADHRDAWKGTVVLIGQPAEERVEGARAMLADGLYEKFPKPSAALALHVAHDVAAGKVGFVSGPAFASSTSVNITVKGRGGHGAMPHNTVDPIVQAAMLIVDLQTIVSRKVSPIDTGVVTVGSIHGGTKNNIIPDDVKLQLTVRAFRDETRELLLNAIRRKAEGIAHAHDAPKPEVTITEGITPTINDPGLVDRVMPAIRKALGDGNVVGVEPTTGAEDFGLYGQDGVPVFMFRLGTVAPKRLDEALNGGKPLPSLHSAEFLPVADDAIPTGIRAMTAAVVELLPPR